MGPERRGSKDRRPSLTATARDVVRCNLSETVLDKVSGIVAYSVIKTCEILCGGTPSGLSLRVRPSWSN